MDNMQEITRTNREHKDRLFRFIFKQKKDLLSLYNAINNSDYTNPEKLIIYTMEDYVYMGMKNDLSFLIDWNLNVFEHQSTWNPNMPLRGLLYVAAALKKFVELNHLDIFSSKKLMLPIPRYYVFYNGEDKREDEVTLHLTDSMYDGNAKDTSCVEFIAHVININQGHNPKIMEKCPMLYEYAFFVAEIRRNVKQGIPRGEAIDDAVKYCIRNGILADILRGNRAEVTQMLLTEYNEALHISNEKEISFEEGFLKGQLKEKEKTEQEKNRADELQKQKQVFKYKLQNKTNVEISELMNLPVEEIENLLKEINE